jgi:hypothetical protein
VNVCDTISLLIGRIQVMPPTDCQSNLTSRPAPPISEAEFETFERDSGLRLPDFLRRVYTEVANGGFGPAWGVNPLTGDEEMSIASWDRIVRSAKHDDPEHPWPEDLIRLCEIGCNMYYGVDVTVRPSPVFKVDPTCGSTNIDKWLTRESDSVTDWLRAWAEKEPPKWTERTSG